MNYEIFNEDCLEGMKRIETGSVDAIICDPPFGITNCHFDVRLPFEPMWEQFKRVTKRNAAIVLFSQMPFGSDLIQSNRKMFRYEWIWYKNQGAGFLNAKKMPLRCHENILVFYQQLPTYNPVIWYSIPLYRVHYKKHNSRNYGTTKAGRLVRISDTHIHERRRIGFGRDNGQWLNGRCRHKYRQTVYRL